MALRAGGTPTSAQQQWHPQDPEQALVQHSFVERPDVLEALVVAVVGSGVGPGRLRHQAAEAIAVTEPEVLE